MRKVSKTSVLWVCAIIGFILTLYMVEASAEVSVHNGGYGTFDMKKYDEITVNKVLANGDTECIGAYNRYYFADFLFVICFGIFQCMISNAVYRKIKVSYRRIAIGFPIARGIFDIVENILLLITINNYPQINNKVITIASIATQSKIWCIRIWVVLILLGLIYNIGKRIILKHDEVV